MSQIHSAEDLPMAGGAPAPQAAPQPETGNDVREAIAEAIAEHRVILFMKGTPEAPACGFSARTVAALQSSGARFAAVDVLGRMAATTVAAVYLLGDDHLLSLSAVRDSGWRPPQSLSPFAERR